MVAGKETCLTKMKRKETKKIQKRVARIFINMGVLGAIAYNPEERNAQIRLLAANKYHPVHGEK